MTGCLQRICCFLRKQEEKGKLSWDGEYLKWTVTFLF